MQSVNQYQFAPLSDADFEIFTESPQDEYSGESLYDYPQNLLPVHLM